MALGTILLENPLVADLRMEKIQLAKASHLATPLTAVPNEKF